MQRLRYSLRQIREEYHNEQQNAKKMKKIYTLLVLSIIGTVLSAQSVECPDDVVVTINNFDISYDSYGEPTVMNLGSNEVTENITVVNNACNEQYSIVITRKFAIENSTGSELASCLQTISMEHATVEDLTLPADFTIDSGKFEDLDPELAGRPEPWEVMVQYSNIFATYEDQIFYTAEGARAVRTWTILDWCTGMTKSHRQILRINTLTEPLKLSGSVSGCDGSEVTFNNIEVTTDQAGFDIDYGSCNLNTSVLDFVNCVAANNDISQSNNFIINIEKDINDLNGVTTLDLVFTQKHILGVTTFKNECELLAADVNNDQRVSAIDLVETRKLILGIYSEWPQSTSWRFFNAQSLGNGSSVLNDNDLTFPKSAFPLTELEIIAVKVGDVNGSADGN